MKLGTIAILAVLITLGYIALRQAWEIGILREQIKINQKQIASLQRRDVRVLHALNAQSAFALSLLPPPTYESVTRREELLWDIRLD